MVAAHANLLDEVLHAMTQLDPMVYFMIVVVTIAFGITAMVLVELFPGRPGTEAQTPPAEADENDREGAKTTTVAADRARAALRPTSPAGRR